MGASVVEGITRGEEEGGRRKENRVQRPEAGRPVLRAQARQRLAAVLPGRSGTGRGADSFCVRI